MTVLTLQKKYDKIVGEYDSYYDQILIFSDMLCKALTSEPKQDGGVDNYFHKYKKYKQKYLKKI
jgi:hypothetical protein